MNAELLKAAPDLCYLGEMLFAGGGSKLAVVTQCKIRFSGWDVSAREFLSQDICTRRIFVQIHFGPMMVRDSSIPAHFDLGTYPSSGASAVDHFVIRTFRPCGISEGTSWSSTFRPCHILFQGRFGPGSFRPRVIWVAGHFDPVNFRFHDISALVHMRGRFSAETFGSRNMLTPDNSLPGRFDSWIFYSWDVSAHRRCGLGTLRRFDYAGQLFDSLI